MSYLYSAWHIFRLSLSWISNRIIDNLYVLLTHVMQTFSRSLKTLWIKKIFAWLTFYLPKVQRSQTQSFRNYDSALIINEFFFHILPVLLALYLNEEIDYRVHSCYFPCLMFHLLLCLVIFYLFILLSNDRFIYLCLNIGLFTHD